MKETKEKEEVKPIECSISKSVKKLTPSGKSFFESTLSVQGRDMAETKKIFDARWEKET